MPSPMGGPQSKGGRNDALTVVKRIPCIDLTDTDDEDDPDADDGNLLPPPPPSTITSTALLVPHAAVPAEQDSGTVADQLVARRAQMKSELPKRKLEDGGEDAGPSKRIAVPAAGGTGLSVDDTASTSGGGRVGSAGGMTGTGAKQKLTMAYPNGALRQTATPGRRSGPLSRNAITYGDIFYREDIKTAYLAAFFFVPEELRPYLPLGGDDTSHPIYISSDIHQDRYHPWAADFVGVPLEKGARIHFTDEQFRRVVPALQAKYNELYGGNYRALYKYQSVGLAHTKLFIIHYGDFIRVVITSANAMSIDWVSGSNHFFIQDFPLRYSTKPLPTSPYHLKMRSLPSPREPKERADFLSKLERDEFFYFKLRSHAAALGAPADILELLDRADYSTVQVDLYDTIPGDGQVLSEHGIGAFGVLSRRCLKDLITTHRLDRKAAKLVLEVMTASLGGLDERGMQHVMCLLLRGEKQLCVARQDSLPKGEDQTLRAALGFGPTGTILSEEQGKKLSDEKQKAKAARVKKADDALGPIGELPIRIYYPTSAHVGTCDDDAQQAASNMGASAVNWKDRSPAFRSLFRNFENLDPGRLGHLKMYMLRDDTAPATAPPLWLSIGSSNFSAAALGKLYLPPKEEGVRLSAKNYELNVFVPGDKIVSLLEPGSVWTDILPFKIPAEKYGKDDKPFTSKVWVKEGREQD